MEANEQWWHHCPSKMLSFLHPWKFLLLQSMRMTQLGTICVHALNLHANSFSQSIPTPKLLSQWAHILLPSTKKNYVHLNCYILKNIEHGALLVCRRGTSAISNPQDISTTPFEDTSLWNVKKITEKSWKTPSINIDVRFQQTDVALTWVPHKLKSTWEILNSEKSKGL